MEVLSREEVQQLEHAARTERDKLIIRILADTGLWVGELLGLWTNDLVEQNRNYYLHVRGKGAQGPPRAGAPGLPVPPGLHRARPAEG